MSYEIEVKYRDVDHSRLARLLEGMAARPIAEQEERDFYLNHPARDFAQTNEAFRIRTVGTRNRITYKGPKRPGPTKTREEIEIGFDEGPETYEALTKLFGYLGFRHVATVTKWRRSFLLNREGFEVAVVLDRVEDLGDFAEVEVVADDASIPAAQKVILELADVLGLSEIEPRSYLRMILERFAAGTAESSPQSP
jgi:adenylate cyclase class 2